MLPGTHLTVLLTRLRLRGLAAPITPLAEESMTTLWIRLLSTVVTTVRDAFPGILACAFLMLSASIPANASEEMGFVYVVKTDPSTPTTVFAGAQRGVFKSMDEGKTWAATGLTQGTVALAIAPATPTSPTTVYAGANSGLLKSVDGGTNWTTAGVSDPICSVEIDPAIPTTLYASTCSQIIRSVDGGANWTSVSPTDESITPAIAAGPPMMLYAASARDDGVRVFSSADGGEAWNVASVTSPDPSYVPLWGPLAFSVSIDPTMSTTVYVNYSGWGCDNDGCFTTGAISKSTDGGASWFRVDGLLYYGSWVSPQVAVSQVAIDPLASTTLYAAWNVYCDQFDPYCVEDHWISKSADGGASWSRISDLSAFALWFDPLTRTVLYASTDSNVLKSMDGGVTWSATGPPPTEPPPTPPTDTAPPDTSITSAADGTGAALAYDAVTLSASLTLRFTGTDDVGLSRFECQLDGAGFSACASPLAYNALTLGRHTFEVRTVDTSSNVDATPARYTWTVDAAPETTITGVVDGRGRSIANGGSTPSDKITFRFAGTDNGTVAGCECQLDAQNFTSCTSPVTYTGVTRGAHTFRVRAVDNNAFRDPSPAAFTWRR
jgi:hypothetical protein